MRTWTRLVPALLLAAPFTFAPLRADAEIETADQKLTRLQNELDSLRKKVEKLEVEVTTNSVQGAKIAADLNEIKGLLQRMATEQDQAIRRYYAPPTGGVPAVAAPTTATITVRNQYTANANVLINGRAYPVLAGQEVRIPGVPLGTVNYEVDVDGYGVVQTLRSETLRANGRIINIFPRLGG